MKKFIPIIIVSLFMLAPTIGSAALDFNIEDLFGADTVPTVLINKVNIIWSTDTYTPFDYQGRNLPVAGSKITIDVIVDAIGGSAKSFKYSWFLEDVFQQNDSGYGKDSFEFYAGQLPGNHHTVRVQIFNEDRTVFEERTIQIPVTKPDLVIYSSHGNSHFSNQASIVSTVLANKKFSFVAKPYFFSVKKLTDLIFEWNFAGQKPIVSSDYDASVFDLTISDKNDDRIISSNLRVNVKNPAENKQQTSKSIKVNIQ